MTPSLPAEFALVAACCRWPRSPARDAAVRAAASAAIDWDRLECVIARHRVGALAYDGLRRAGIAVPPPVERRLAAVAAAGGRVALAMAHETLRLQRMFDEAGLPALFIKGAGLAMLAYGELGVQQSRDIDLLITPEGALAARHLLQRLGYRLMMPSGLDDRQFVRFSGFHKEALFVNMDLSIAVDLHWRLTDNRWLLPGIDAFSATQVVAMGGGVRTLSDDALFAYLCAHGARHGWARLKWLAAVAAFLARRDGEGIEQLYQAAIGLGAGRTPAVTMLLCHRVLGLALAPSLLSELSGDRVVAALVANALRCMTYRDGAAEFGTYSLTGLQLMLSRLVLVPGRHYFWSEIEIEWRSADDRTWIPLPRPMGFLYHLLRLPMWLWRLGRRFFGRPTA